MLVWSSAYLLVGPLSGLGLCGFDLQHFAVAIQGLQALLVLRALPFGLDAVDVAVQGNPDIAFRGGQAAAVL